MAVVRNKYTVDTHFNCKIYQTLFSAFINTLKIARVSWKVFTSAVTFGSFNDVDTYDAFQIPRTTEVFMILPLFQLFPLSKPSSFLSSVCS